MQFAADAARAQRRSSAPEGKLWAWFPRLPVWAQMCTAFGLGLLGATGQEPYGYPLVMFATLVLAFVMMRRLQRPAAAARVGWAYAFGYFLLALVWILQPFQIEAARYGWMAPFALVLLSGGMALYWGAAFWVARMISRRTWPLIFALTAAELARAYWFTGFPWANLPQALVNSVAGQGLAWGGPHGLMLWLCAMAWLISFPALRRGLNAVVAVQALLLVATVAVLQMPVWHAASARGAHVVRLVQPNVPQRDKWNPDLIEQNYARLLDLIAQPRADGTRPDLVVLPETAIPWALERSGPVLPELSAAASGVPVVLGLQRGDGVAFYNSLVVTGASGAVTQIYDKHHLVPYGEYMPLGDWLSDFGIHGLAAREGHGYSSGPGAQLLDLGALGQALPLICYEAVFAHDVNAAPARPDFLLQITNDAWFGQDAGPQQHLAQAQMRAIEQGLPMVRAANTGITAMIDPRGRIVAALPLGAVGVIDATLPEPRAPTLYSRLGDAPTALIAGLMLTALLLRRMRNRRSKRR